MRKEDGCNLKHRTVRYALEKQCDLENDKALVVKASDLEHGVTGIVASQMVKTL